MERFQQPNSDMCFVCGRSNPKGLYLTFYDNGENEVYTATTLGDEFQGFPGVVHGGILASILDELVGRVATIKDHHRLMMSVTLQVKYRLPTPTNTPLEFVGRIVRLRGSLGKAVGMCYLPDGRLSCESEMTMIDVPEALWKEMDVETLGWRVDS
jgi:acyl-coenzyme A thioesterase PaaI-like protein